MKLKNGKLALLAVCFLFLSGCTNKPQTTTEVATTTQITQAEQTPQATQTMKTTYKTESQVTKTHNTEVTTATDGEPFSYSFTKDMGEEIGKVVFTVEGLLNVWGSRTHIHKLTISNLNGEILQEFSGLDVDTLAYEEIMYGLSFEDWNFDSYLDISLWRWTGGSSMNKPTYYWLWDNKLGKFVENEQLTEISCRSHVIADSENKQIVSNARAGYGNYYIAHYKYYEGNFVKTWVKKTEYVIEGDDNAALIHIIIKEFVNGELIEVENYYVNANEFVF